MKERKGKNTNDLSLIINAMNKFQDGYSQRDISLLDEFMSELFGAEENVRIIGTGAVNPGGYEWCDGIEKAQEPFESDWKYWGDLRKDIKNAKIDIKDNTAWIALCGTVTKFFDSDSHHRRYDEIR